MKKKTWIFIIAGALVLLAVIVLLLLNSFFKPVKKIDGSIPYNESSSYMPYNDSFIEISKDGVVTEYSVSSETNSIKKTGSFHINLPIKKYISSNLFITEDNSIMFGSIKGTEQKNLGTVKNATDISVGTGVDHALMRTAVVTSDGLLFVQGDNSTGALGIEAKQVNGEFVQVPYLQNIAKAICGINCILVLSTDGEVFLSGTLGELSYQTFTKLEVAEKVKDIEASDISNTLIALGVNGNVYEIGISFFQDLTYINDAPHDGVFYSSFHKIPRLKNIVFMTTPDLTAYAIDKNDKAYYWGSDMMGKSIFLEKVFKQIYGLPKYDKIWHNSYFYVLSGNEIKAYSW